jgi:nicotinamidase-related amidase
MQSDTAIILIGYQNEMFHPEGFLHGSVKDCAAENKVLPNTVALIEALHDTDVPIIHTTINFTDNYEELEQPVGLLKMIVDSNALKAGSFGSETIGELRAFGDRILDVPGKRGLNAFIGTDLDEVLKARGIRTIVLAGVVTSICVDSTARLGMELGYRVVVLEDCTAGRTMTEQELYCQSIFPIYSEVMKSGELLDSLGVVHA